MKTKDRDKAAFSIARFMDETIELVTKATISIQKSIYEYLKEEILRFEINDDRFVAGQDLRKRIIYIEDRIEERINKSPYSNTINEFLGGFQSIEDRNIAFQKDYNDLTVALKSVSPARKLIAEQAEYAIRQGVKTAYIQPIKYLVMQQVTSGVSITEAKELLKKWDNGELSNGKFTNNTPAPNLQRYSTQIARDSTYGVHRTFQSIVKEKYGLGNFIYAGPIVAESRPLCRHLIAKGKPISFSEIDSLIAQFPEGLIAGTNASNFTQYCGGYNCQHQAFAVR